MKYRQPVLVFGEPAEIVIAPIWYNLALVRLPNGDEEVVDMKHVEVMDE